MLPYDELIDTVAILPRHKILRDVDIQSLDPIFVLGGGKKKQNKKDAILKNIKQGLSCELVISSLI